MHVALLGMGRLARSLAPALEAAGHRVSRWRRGEPVPEAELRWITVRDDAIVEVARTLPPGGVLLHASGLLDWELLRPHRPAGSLHVLQTFPGPEVAVPALAGVPAAVAGDPEAQALARELALSLGLRPFALRGDRRLYHAACALAGNLGVVLLAEAARLLESAGAEVEDPLALLLPLCRSALENAASRGPAEALTGPIARGDEATIRAHETALAERHPELLPAYRALGERARVLAGRRGSTRTTAR